jgi:dihydroorotase
MSYEVSSLTSHLSYLIRGGHVIDPASGFDAGGDVVVGDGRIAYCGAALTEAPAGVSVLDAAGCVVAPGFVDLHTHLRFPGFPEKETVASGTAAAAAGGFTTVCAMANTAPVVDRVEVLLEVLGEIGRTAVVRVHQLAAVSYGLRGEELTDLPALAAAGAVAFSDDGKPVWSENVMRAALAAGASLDRPISVHEEDPAIVLGGVANAGPTARRLGLAEWPCRGEASITARDLALLAETGGRLHVAHVSCAETVPLLLRAKDRGLSVTAEVTPHHLRLSDCLLAGNYPLGLPPAHPCVKVNPPLRSDEDVQAMIAALADGTIDAVATDHAPHSAPDKSGSFATAAFGFSGIETALPLLLDLVRSGHLTMPAMIARLTIGPARAFDLDAGTLAPGAPGDVCVFDPDEEWTVDEAALLSRGKNTPLLGTTLRGRVRWTLVGGEVVPRA